MVSLPRSRRATISRLVTPAFAVLAHLPSLRDGYTRDDALLLGDNPWVRTWAGLGVLVRSPLFLDGPAVDAFPFYRPASSALFWISYQLLGPGPLGQHALNLLLFALLALGLRRALLSSGVSLAAATAATMIFSAHPATAELVAYVSGRQDLLGWTLALFALAETGRGGRARAWLAELGLVLLAMLSKELFFMLPAGTASVAWGRGGAPRARAAAARGAIAGAIVLLLRAHAGVPALPSPGGARASLPGVLAFMGLRWAGLLLLPLDLCSDLTVSPIAPPLAFAALALFGGAAAALAVRAIRAGGPRAGLGLAGLAIALATLVVHGIRAASTGLTSDRYFVSFGLGVLLVAAGFEVTPRSAIGGRVLRASPFAVGALALAFLPGAWARDLAFVDDDALAAAEYASRPDDPQVEWTTGQRLVERGEVDRGYALCKASADATPRSDHAYLCVGEALLLRRDASSAVPYLRAYASTHEGRAAARRAYLAALFATGGRAEARARVDAWSTRYPASPELTEAEAELARDP